MSESIFMRIEGEGKDIALSQAVRDLSENERNRVLHIFEIGGLARIPLAPFAYWVSERVRHLFAKLPSFEQEGRTVKQGLATTDDFRFIRVAWEILPKLRGDLGRIWFPFAKGGSYSPFYADVFLHVKWGDIGAECKANIVQRYPYLNGNAGFVAKNTTFYFRPGLTWPLRTQSGLAFRALPSGCVFGHKGPCAFLESGASDDLLTLLALTTSKVFRGLVEIQMSFGSYEVGVIQRTVVPRNLDPRLGELALAAWNAKRRQDTANPTSHAFLRAALAQPGSTLAKGIESWSSLLGESTAVLDTVQSEIDDIAYRLYGLGEEDRRAIEKTLGGPEGGPQDSTGDSGEDEEADESASMGANGPDLVADLFDYLFGCSVGRWDIRYATGEKTTPEHPAPFDPLPACPPAQLQNTLGLPASPEDVHAGYPIEIPWDGILVDDENHPHDGIKRVREVLGIVWEDRAEAVEQETCEILEVRSLRDWFRNSNNFFAAHLRRHSKSRRQAPIYWPLRSPNGLYTVWLYYHRLTADTLFTVLRDYLKPKLEFTEHRAFQLRQEAGTTPSASQRRDIAEAEDLVGDLLAFKAELERVAPLFRPNLNDGVIINFAPLCRMIGLPRWRRDCQSIWNKMARGDYDWAHLAMHLWPERVVPKCATDRSLAIAHGLDETFWKVNPQDPGKWISCKVTEGEIRDIVAERSSAAVKAAVQSLVEAVGNEGAPRRGRRGVRGQDEP